MYRTVFALSVLVALPASAKDPVARTKALVEVLKKVKTVDVGQTLNPDDQKSNQAVYKQLDTFYDFTVLATEPLVPHKSKLTADQLAKIKSMFTELLRLVAYPKSGGFLRNAKYELSVGKKPTDVKMSASRPEDDFEATVVFHWQDQGDALRIIDVSFDGVSLVKDYTNQFGRIINKEGGDGLIKKLSKRLEKERKRQGV